jgi:hypothetical protein
MLNLFQHPLWRRAARLEKWTLKQVQGDGRAGRPKLGAKSNHWGFSLSPGCEALRGSSSMLIEPRDEVGCHANVERPVFTTGEDVDAGLLHKRSACGGMDAETSSA